MSDKLTKMSILFEKKLYQCSISLLIVKLFPLRKIIIELIHEENRTKVGDEDQLKVTPIVHKNNCTCLYRIKDNLVCSSSFTSLNSFNSN